MKAALADRRPGPHLLNRLGDGGGAFPEWDAGWNCLEYFVRYDRLRSMKDVLTPRPVALTDVETRVTLVFHNPPWRLKSLKFGIGGSRVTLVHRDGRVHVCVVNAKEETVRQRFAGW